MQPLTTKQRAFAGEYVRDESPRQAAIRAGYSPKAASQQAGKLLHDPRIQDLIAKLREAEAPPDEMSLEGHLREMARLRDKLEDAFDNPEITTPQVSALRCAADAEIAKGKVLGFYSRSSRDPDPPSMGRPKARETMGDILRGTLRPGSRKPVEPRSNGSGEGG